MFCCCERFVLFVLEKYNVDVFFCLCLVNFIFLCFEKPKVFDFEDMLI